MERRGEGLPQFVIGFVLARELLNTPPEVLPEFFVAHLLHIHADDGESLRQPLVPEKTVKGGDELPPGQVSAGAEDDDGHGIPVRSTFP